MIRFTSLVAALWVATTGAVLAQQPVVVELYTSQGCSSCPPADRVLGELAERDDVIALAFHVDYWDYLGWKDEFANPEHTKRQRAYARAAGERTIYTPQMIIGGKDHVIGSKPMKINNLLRKHSKATAPVKLRVKRSGGQITIEAAASAGLRGGAVVDIVTYRPKSTVDIRRGEMQAARSPIITSFKAGRGLAPGMAAARIAQQRAHRKACPW
jgi:hypothetical protein